ncbi:sensor histidine kinase [Aureivirga sp. CE67]|uniref:sensor histidine kinase n=1 Tax=Aureivirga sp. CE67 TaxID=1788983 RepID=UPI0018C971A4|nr:HAMP domain-containing sensor histidine kinase [Aureivirga sp. CE67]
MIGKNYTTGIVFICITILLVIGTQFYWNRKNYVLKKHNLKQQIQKILDNSIESYYTDKTQNSFFTFSNNESKINSIDTIILPFRNSPISKKREFRKILVGKYKNDSLKMRIPKEIESISLHEDSLKKNFPIRFEYPKRKFYSDKEEHSKIDSLFAKILVSVFENSISVDTLGNKIKKELKKQEIDLDFKLSLKENHFYDQFSDTYYSNLKDTILKSELKIKASPLLFANDTDLEMTLEKDNSEIFKKMYVSIFLSLILTLSVIACLIYLLKTIYKQKQLSEIKNDLISNITHEFKTPIATTFAAIEGMKNFNVLNDQKRTEKYLNISTEQLQKLNLMVEKLLETATLKSDSIDLNIEKSNLSELIKKRVQKYQERYASREFILNSLDNIEANIDSFHFENAVNNIFDNAIKYGGDKIECNLYQKSDKVIIEIFDNGIGIPKTEKDKIFEQFYRISEGDKHDVKGFGIGLYYTKKIIEKHFGNIRVIYKKGKSIFQIELPKSK